jgi:hypothetical protein
MNCAVATATPPPPVPPSRSVPEHGTQFKLIPLDPEDIHSASFEGDAPAGGAGGKAAASEGEDGSGSPRKKAPESKRVFRWAHRSSRGRAGGGRGGGWGDGGRLLSMPHSRRSLRSLEAPTADAKAKWIKVGGAGRR